MTTEQLPLVFAPPTRKYVRLQYESTRRNPAFKDRVVPYRWQNIVDAEEAERVKREAEDRWPDVTVTIVEMKDGDR